MRKKLFSVFISVVMLLTSLVSITTSAEETVNILETYTFEEFLALSAEEVCATSDEIAEEYNKRFTSCKSTLNGNVLPCINVVTYDTYETITEQSDALCIPADFMDISGSTTNFHITMKWNNHTDNTYADFVAKTYVWLIANPKVELLTFCSICLLTEKTTTNENFLGDIDQNGTIDITDATNALTIYARTAAGLSVENYTGQQRINADVNNDSIIDLSDAAAILMYYARNAAGLQPTWDTVLA